MRHLNFGRKLSRDTNARKALLNNLANSMLLHGYLTPTLTKAKFAQGYVEKMVTNAKKNKIYTTRKIASKISNKALIKLITEVGPGFEQRNGGYTRIVKLGYRRGDSTQMAKLELLEWDKSKANTIKPKSKKVKAKVSKKITDPAKTSKKTLSTDTSKKVTYEKTVKLEKKDKNKK